MFNQLKQQEIEYNIQKATTLAKGYYAEYQVKLQTSNVAEAFGLPTVEKYVEQCESLVTPILFQSPAYVKDYLIDNSKEDEENLRNEFYRVFQDWNPNYYVVVFCQEIRKLFNL